MENFDWKSFWASYRNVNFQQEDDLFYQVGKTINKKPIDRAVFQAMVEDIISKLNLDKEDTLMELCCGNGLLTYPLSNFVKYICAFDFTEHLIETAKKAKNKENIFYKVGDAKSDFFSIFDLREFPKKYLMNDSLGYFIPSELDQIISLITSKVPSFKFYITGVPNDRLKWNFYNTPERKEEYLKGVQQGDITNKGLGRWWLDKEFYEIQQKYNLKLQIIDQPEFISNYRSNILFEL